MPIPFTAANIGDGRGIPKGISAHDCADFHIRNIAHKNIASSVYALEERILNLQRSAAGRGNLAMSNGMVLLRISLPEYFKHYDPILLNLNSLPNPEAIFGA